MNGGFLKRNFPPISGPQPTQIRTGRWSVSEVFSLKKKDFWPRDFIPISATGGTISNVTISGVPFILHAFTNAGNNTFSLSSKNDSDGKFIVEMWGAGGAGAGGAGGYSYAEISPSFPDSFTAEVGNTTIRRYTFNQSTANSGGRRSALWKVNDTTEILVAGGGGGGGTYSGGAGGGSSGQASGAGTHFVSQIGQNVTVTSAGGGTQSAGGAAGTATSWPDHNPNGVAGRRHPPQDPHGPGSGGNQGAAGGGGYFSGGSSGASAWTSGPGGGGSGRIGTGAINAVTTAGNFETPGNSGNPLRGTYGNRGTQGVVFIRYKADW